ncbi:MAG: hypothetical protein GC184_07860 [Rhizobiales bacterium]|nr:hypothetical protein [Hyphomicrobiales bacterium]
MSFLPAISPKHGHRLFQFIIAAFAFGFLVNAALMLAAPAYWYAQTPGVEHTGAFNPHFVRDIGLAYLTLSIMALVALVQPRRAVAWLGAITIYLALHGGLHLWDIAAERLPPSHLLVDLPGVFLPPFLTAALTWRAHRQEKYYVK